ncbi:MAG: hypothetical protein ACYTKD_28560 [Planctomycetota bacterium]|jgi:hypothetical protein
MKRTHVAILAACLAAPPAGAMTSAVRSQIEADWVRQEQVTRNLKASDPGALDGLLARGNRLVADMYDLGARGAADRAKAVLSSVASERGGGDTQALYIKARWAIRELAFSNPAVDFGRLLFVRRQWPRQNHQCAHRMGEAQTPGANLCILERLSPDSPVVDILDAATAKGGVDRPDLSYDAKRIVFPYARPRARPTAYGMGRPGVRGGACIMYDMPCSSFKRPSGSARRTPRGDGARC